MIYIHYDTVVFMNLIFRFSIVENKIYHSNIIIFKYFIMSFYLLLTFLF